MSSMTDFVIHLLNKGVVGNQFQYPGIVLLLMGAYWIWGLTFTCCDTGYKELAILCMFCCNERLRKYTHALTLRILEIQKNI